MRADLRVCDSVLHVSTTDGLRDMYPFGSVSDAALAETEDVTGLTTRSAPSGIAKGFFRQGEELGKSIMDGQLGKVGGTIGRVLDLFVEVRVAQNNV
ncbi:hypothetical protein ACKRZS_004218 [Fusarium odoratissimum]